MNGDCASRARRRAISVLPTPVGPIIRMFFGATSSASSGGQLLPAQAVAQRDRDRALGLGLADDVLVELGDDLARRQRVDRRSACARARRSTISELFDGRGCCSCRCRSRAAIVIACSAISRGVERRCCCTSALAAASANAPPEPIADDAIVGLDQVAGARQQEHRLAVEHDQHRLEAAQHAVGAPVLGQLDRRRARGCRGTARAWPRSARTARTSRRPSRQTRRGCCRCRGGGSSGRSCLTTVLPERDLAVAGQHRVVVRGAPPGSSWRGTSIPSL